MDVGLVRLVGSSGVDVISGMEKPGMEMTLGRALILVVLSGVREGVSSSVAELVFVG